MDIEALQAKKQTILDQQVIDGRLLIVKENRAYRWFEYDGQSVQSLMNKSSPEQMVMPVYQSLLLFLLIHNNPLNVLNLGLGGASIERTLSTLPDISLTSVDASLPIIDMAKRYFNLPKDVSVICEKAEEFILKSSMQYDVVICDLFIGEKSPDFIFSQRFYMQLATITADNAVLMLNLQADTEERLLHLLLAIKKQFAYVALIEFDDYSNIVIIGAAHEIPAKATLKERLANFSQVTFTHLDKAIEKIRYLPPHEY